MAKKTKERDFNLYHFEETKKIEKKRNKKKSKQVKEKESDNKFSFDNEIVIGVTKLEQPKKTSRTSKVTKQKNSKTIDAKKQDSKNNEMKREKINKKSKKSNLEVKPKKKQEKLKKENKSQQKNKKEQNYKKIKKEILTPEEYERKEKIKKRNLYIAKYIMLGILLIGVILCAMFSPLFNIKDIIIEGNETISTEQIISLSKIQLGDNLFKINSAKLNKQIKENPYIDEIKITRKLPSAIVISIIERKPAYLIEYANGYIYIDKKGYILKISETKLELPILQGTETILNEDSLEGERLCIEDLNKLSIILKVMQIATDNDIQNLINRIDIENENNIKLIFETEEKTEIGRAHV